MPERRGVMFLKENAMSVSRENAGRGNDDRPAVVLTAEARDWLASLPRNVRPKMLMLKFPRIINEISRMWPRPMQCEKYLDELLFDTRDGTRQGFPAEIAFELSYLKTLVQDLINQRRIAANPNYINVWDQT